MQRQVLFVQGGGEGTHDEWDNKLVASLERELGPDYEIRYPRMPNEGDPQYASWKQALEKELEKLRDGAILIGHLDRRNHPDQRSDRTHRKGTPGGASHLAAASSARGGWPGEEIGTMSDLGTRLRLRGCQSICISAARTTSVPLEHAAP